MRRLLALLILIALGAANPSAMASESGPGGRDRVRAMVVEEARDMRFAVSLALAVAQAESDFDPMAESRVGARGVMQIMPATALDEYGIPPDMLWNSRVNIRLGIHFLQRLIRRYGGRTDLALSYYNGGSAVGDLPGARVMPATFDYVRRVKSLQREYQRSMWSGDYLAWMPTAP